MTALMDLTITPLTVPTTAKVPAARHKIRRLAEPLVGAELAADVELMLAEGLANALLHGRGGATVTVTVDEKTLRVEVRDQGPGFVVAGRVDHGRGHALIAALAARWEFTKGPDGTCLAFEVDRGAL